MLVHKGGQINNVEMSNYKIAVSCVQRMEIIVKMKKKEKKSGGGWMCTKNGSYCEKEKVRGVRVDVNGEVKLL